MRSSTILPAITASRLRGPCDRRSQVSNAAVPRSLTRAQMATGNLHSDKSPSPAEKFDPPVHHESTDRQPVLGHNGGVNSSCPSLGREANTETRSWRASEVTRIRPKLATKWPTTANAHPHRACVVDFGPRTSPSGAKCGRIDRDRDHDDFAQEIATILEHVSGVSRVLMRPSRIWASKLGSGNDARRSPATPIPMGVTPRAQADLDGMSIMGVVRPKLDQTDFGQKAALKARSCTVLLPSGSDFGRNVDVRGVIRRVASGPRKPAPLRNIEDGSTEHFREPSRAESRLIELRAHHLRPLTIDIL